MRFLGLLTSVLILSPTAIAGPSFLNDVVPVLSKSGCNQGACHGKLAGQNGFRLSLRGYAPDQDHHWLTREFDGRRLNRANPDQSLLLLKATGQIRHDGGKLFDVGSREYTVLRDWIATGTPGPNTADPKITKLTVTPGKVLGLNESLPLQAMAIYSDGTTKDVTWLTRFDSNDANVLNVTTQGVVTAKRSGATSVRAAFLTEVAVASFVVPYAVAIPDAKYAGGRNVVDTLVLNKLRELRIEPSGECNDTTFLRRAMLDTLGILPTVGEVKAFLADPAPDKRAKLVEALLLRPEFDDYWAFFLSDLLQNRQERDHDVRGLKGVREFHTWLRQQVAAHRGWDAIARDVLLATGDNRTTPAIGYYIVTLGEHRAAEQSEVAESVAQAFLGTRIGCARCHNHPLERYTQDDFYHFSAYFTRLKLDRHFPQDQPTTLTVGTRDANALKQPVQVRQPRTGEMLPPRTLDRTQPPLSDDPRQALVEWIVSPKNDAFRGAMVNRLWKHFFREGLVEPVDDLRATNPPSNPALFAALSEEFSSHGYDFRHIMRLILNSQTYQRTSATLPGNAADTRYGSHYLARRLPAEVLLDAVCQSTGSPELFLGYPYGLRAVQIPNAATIAPFLRHFGGSMRVTACACERSGDVTLPQMLTLTNGEAIRVRLFDGQGEFRKLVETNADDHAVTEEIFLRTFSRRPRPEESAALHKELALLKGQDDTGGLKRLSVYQDLMWALLNAKEFAFNH